MFNYYQPTKIHFGEHRLEELGVYVRNMESVFFW